MMSFFGVGCASGRGGFRLRFDRSGTEFEPCRGGVEAEVVGARSSDVGRMACGGVEGWCSWWGRDAGDVPAPVSARLARVRVIERDDIVAAFSLRSINICCIQV